MAAADPRSFLRSILLGVTATRDDNVTPVTILVIYEGGPETYRYIFEVIGFDACITVGRHIGTESGDGKRIQDEPLRYNARVPVHVSAVDKTGITATKVLNKIRVSMITQIEANAQTNDYTWILQRGQEVNQRQGGYDPLWQDSYMVLQRPLAS